MFRIALLFIGVSFFTQLVFGQARTQALGGYTEASWSERDGLPSSQVWSIAQSREGYLLIGTNAGLVGFDGLRFFAWHTIGATALPARRVVSLFTAQDGTIWLGFGGPGGISRVLDGRVTNYDRADGVNVGNVTSLGQRKDGTIWASSSTGLLEYAHESWHPIGPAEGLPPGLVFSTFEDSKGNLWVGSAAGVFQQTAGGHTFQVVEAGSYFAQRFAEDSTGTLWMTDPQRGFRAVGQGTALPLSAGVRGSGVQILHDRRGQMWIATLGQGVWLVRPNAERPTNGIETITIDQGLPSNAVRALFEDNDGNVWAGTQSGLHQFAPTRLTGTTTLGLVRAVEAAPDGSVWMATTGGGVVKLRNGQRVWYGPAQGLPSSIVTALHIDARGTLWVATDRGIARSEGNGFTLLPTTNDHMLNRVYSMTTDSTGGLWLCDAGQGLFHSDQGRLVPLNPKADDNRCDTLGTHEDESHDVWVGMSGGRVASVRNSGQVQVFDLPAGSQQTHVIAVDKAHNVWIGDNAGVSRLSHGQMVTVAQKNGLPDSAALMVVNGEDGFLWVGTNSGILRLSLEEFDRVELDRGYQVHFTLYDTSDGLAGLPMRLGTPAAVRATDGTLWFVTGSGVTMADPRTLTHRDTPLRARIDGLIVDGRRINPWTDASLPPLTSTVEVDYSAITFASPRKVRFRYFMEGYDKTWKDSGTRRETLYTNLPPRRYRFHVIASNNDGTWSQMGDVVDFRIRPTFYQTYWFYGFAMSALACSAWLVWNLRLRQLRRQFSLVVSERVRMSREIHDTLLQSLVGVALRLDDLSAHDDIAQSPVKAVLVQTRKYVEEYIRETRQSIWNLRSPQLDRSDLAGALREAGLRAVEATPIRFNLTVGGSSYRSPGPVEQQLLRIGEEAIINAVRHAQPSEVHMTLHYGEEELVLRTSDDGEGFAMPSDEADHHYGLAGMRERAAQIGGRLTIETHSGGGTTIEVIVPAGTLKSVR